METTPSYETPARLAGMPSWLITHTSVHAFRLVQEAFAANGARHYQYALMAALAEFGPSSQAALGRRCGIDRSDVVAAVNDLVERDLVERTPDPADRRRNTITLTAAGKRRLAKLDKALGAVQEQLLAPLNDAERKQLTALLTRVLEHQLRLAD
ncbi:MarR family winged helix-turn-helix transcriptional regulator [Streptomyces boninensis]|uniref:MarR family winged helix-turn-helix transcriptional regulator n=1 Tax=Streptomyces boninensis TaxID=2039455 RepID=UPI003B21751D